MMVFNYACCCVGLKHSGKVSQSIPRSIHIMALEFASLDNKQRNSTAAPFGVAMNPSGVSSPSFFFEK